MLAAVLIALFPPRSSLELQVSSFSATVQDLATGALGVERMQVTMALVQVTMALVTVPKWKAGTGVV